VCAHARVRERVRLRVQEESFLMDSGPALLTDDRINTLQNYAAERPTAASAHADRTGAAVPAERPVLGASGGRAGAGGGGVGLGRAGAPKDAAGDVEAQLSKLRQKFGL
jgi:hypothetical protein